MDEVVCEDKWYTLPFDAKLGLEVAQDVTEVYVKELKNTQGQSVKPVESGKTRWRMEKKKKNSDCLTCPLLRTMMLSLWRSPIPRT